jgi:serine phosphatase RsbU (regulator of sigma subunit)
MRVLLITAFLLAAMYAPLVAMKPLIIDDPFSSVQFGKDIDYIEDKNKSITIETITDEKMVWTRSKSNSINFGFTPSVYWFRFAVDNRQTANREVYLEISYPMLDYIELYVPQKNGSFLVKKTGDHYPFNDREIVDRNFIIPLLAENGLKTCYIRIETSSSLNFSILLMSNKAYIKRINIEYPLFWIYYGLMMVMVLYNLFLFLSIRELRYILYSMFITAFILFQLTLNGLAFQYLWSDKIWWANNSLPFLMCYTCFSAGVFVRSYLNTKLNFPRFDKILFFMSIVPCFVWTVASLIFSYRISIIGATFMAMYSAIIMYSSGVVGVYYRSRAGRFIVIGFTLLVIGVIFFVLKTFGVLPTNLLTQWSIQIGSACIVILLSLGLADEINVMKNKLQDLNVNLEQKVKERTEELEAAMNELEAMNDEIVRARDAIWGEMQLAKKIQTVLLPREPKIPGYELCAYMSPADEVGGDYYDVINVEGRDWIMIGDVSGHGVPAGLIMMMVQTSIRTAVKQNPDMPPSKLLATINSTITDNIRQLGEDKYMTLTVFLTHEEGIFNYSGLHQDIIVYREKTGKIDCIETRGFWIGIEEDISNMVMDDSLSLDLGDVMMIYTDGITEAWDKYSVKDKRNPEKDMFGLAKLSGVLKELGGCSPEDIKNGILKSLENYKCMDDVTMVVIKRTA